MRVSGAVHERVFEQCHCCLWVKSATTITRRQCSVDYPQRTLLLSRTYSSIFQGHLVSSSQWAAVKIYSHGIFNMKGTRMLTISNIEKVSFAHYSTSRLALGSPGCLFVCLFGFATQFSPHFGLTCFEVICEQSQRCTNLFQAVIGRELIWFMCHTAPAMLTWGTLSMRSEKEKRSLWKSIMSGPSDPRIWRTAIQGSQACQVDIYPGLQ